MAILKYLYIARLIFINYNFVIIHTDVDHHKWTRHLPFTHVHNQATHMCTKTQESSVSAHTCGIELVGDLYCMSKFQASLFWYYYYNMLCSEYYMVKKLSRKGVCVNMVN